MSNEKIAVAQPSPEEIRAFQELIEANRYNYVALAYIIFRFGEKDTETEHMAPYDWQVEEWVKLGKHLADPLTRFLPYRLIISSGNGAAKTAFGAMTNIMLMYTQQVRGRITANTLPQMQSIVWPEYDIWCRRARYFDVFFEKLGTSIKSLDEKKAESWRLDTVTWSENNPVAMSGLHNALKAVVVTFEEGPGIPGIIWKYTNGCFSDDLTIRIWLAFGNSDDPNSYFEQKMKDKNWHARRIDTRTLKHVSPEFVQGILDECLGDEDADDFRVRVKGEPRKSAKDSIIPYALVEAALNREPDLKRNAGLPVILTCDPAWTGGDETAIWVHCGDTSILLDLYKLDKDANETHHLTYVKLCKYEAKYGADAVLIDQGEGTSVYSFAVNDGKTHYQLVSFSGTPIDTPEFKDSQYQNIRAQMHYEARDWLKMGGCLGVSEDVEEEKRQQWKEKIQKQLTWTKGTRNAKTLKKQCNSKQEIKDEYLQSPDVSDGFVLRFGRVITERLPENMTEDGFGVVSPGPLSQNNNHNNNMYEDVIEVEYRDLPYR